MEITDLFETFPNEMLRLRAEEMWRAETARTDPTNPLLVLGIPMVFYDSGDPGIYNGVMRELRDRLREEGAGVKFPLLKYINKD